jgi:tetratricopeptide (TPR) repeat protein
MLFKDALRRQPTWEGLHDGLGWSRLRLGRFHLARRAFQAALDRDPGYVDALIGLGSVEFELGAYDEALARLSPALEQLAADREARPRERANVRAKVAWSLYHLGRYDEALVAFEQALRDAPDWHGIHGGIGWTHLRLGRKTEARAAFERALRLNPEYADALEGLRLVSS